MLLTMLCHVTTCNVRVLPGCVVGQLLLVIVLYNRNPFPKSHFPSGCWSRVCAASTSPAATAVQRSPLMFVGGLGRSLLEY